MKTMLCPISTRLDTLASQSRSGLNADALTQSQCRQHSLQEYDLEPMRLPSACKYLPSSQIQGGTSRNKREAPVASRRVGRCLPYLSEAHQITAQKSRQVRVLRLSNENYIRLNTLVQKAVVRELVTNCEVVNTYQISDLALLRYTNKNTVHVLLTQDCHIIAARKCFGA